MFRFIGPGTSFVLLWTMRALLSTPSALTRRLQVPQYNSLRTATTEHWYHGNKQIQKDFQFPSIANHVRTLIGGHDTTLAGAGNPHN